MYNGLLAQVEVLGFCKPEGPVSITGVASKHLKRRELEQPQDRAHNPNDAGAIPAAATIPANRVGRIFAEGTRPDQHSR